MIKLLRTFMPISHEYSGNKFFTIIKNKRYATPLIVVILALGTTDVFSPLIPSSGSSRYNGSFYRFYFQRLAVLGLRSLFFAMSGLMKLFHFLHYGLAVILGFVGIKMLITDFIK